MSLKNSLSLKAGPLTQSNILCNNNTISNPNLTEIFCATLKSCQACSKCLHKHGHHKELDRVLGLLCTVSSYQHETCCLDCVINKIKMLLQPFIIL